MVTNHVDHRIVCAKKGNEPSALFIDEFWIGESVSKKVRSSFAIIAYRKHKRHKLQPIENPTPTKYRLLSLMYGTKDGSWLPARQT